MPCKFASCCCWKIFRRRDDPDDSYVKAGDTEVTKVRYDVDASDDVRRVREIKPVGGSDVTVGDDALGKVREGEFKVAEELKVKTDELTVAEEVLGDRLLDEFCAGHGESPVAFEEDCFAEKGTEGDESDDTSPGNPRNKCALQPGHSLMDWIRLGSSGKDLTGVGPRAGQLSVTKHELSQHNKEYDAWLAIRGKVYNVTAYLPFHPGGPDELMRGVGIDATKLFDQIHPWVNYEQILQKCLVGRLVAFEPGTDVETLFFGEKTPQKDPQEKEFALPSAPTTYKEPKVKFLEKYPPKVDSVSQEDVPEDSQSQPRFDWIQRTRFLNLVFYTKAFSNPLVEVRPPDQEGNVTVTLIYDSTIFTSTLTLHDRVSWPCTVSMSLETGKIDLEFRKEVEKLWENVGELRQDSRPIADALGCCTKWNFIVCEKKQITHNTFLVRLERTDGAKLVVPVGHHVRAFGNVQGQEMSRSYTPIPQSFFGQFDIQSPSTDTICLMIKRYPKGKVSRFITDLETKDLVHLTRPTGDLDLGVLHKRETFVLLAAGTGITPMLSVLRFLLERKIKKCQFARLLFFNKKENDIPFRDQFDNFAEMDNRLKVTHILSEPSSSWEGLTGHVSEEMLHNAIQEHIRDTGYTINHIFAFICGPNPFVTLSIEELQKLGIQDDQIYAFQG